MCVVWRYACEYRVYVHVWVTCVCVHMHIHERYVCMCVRCVCEVCVWGVCVRCVCVWGVCVYVWRCMCVCVWGYVCEVHVCMCVRWCVYVCMCVRCVCVCAMNLWCSMCGGKFDQSRKARGNRDRNREPLTTATHSVFIRTFVFEHRLVSLIPLKIQHFHLAAAVADNIQSYPINQFQ